MSSKKGKKEEEINFDTMSSEEKLKYEIAQELGLFDKVMTTGWKSLSAKESGKIGGILASRKKNKSAPVS